MASVQKVQAYLAYWFQLGKPVVFQNGQTQCLPSPVFQANHYSLSFQQCWRRIVDNPKQCYLSGTDESIADLLSDEWEIVGCARCPMPIPMPVRGIKLSPCPCTDLSSWPNDQIPAPRIGVNTQAHLQEIRQRLEAADQTMRDRLLFAYHHSPGLPKAASEKPEPFRKPKAAQDNRPTP